MKLKNVKDGILAFYCPGCKEMHRVPVNKSYPHNWIFNGDYEAPTFSPSILIRTGHYVPGYKDDDCWCTWNKEHPDEPAPFKCGICHSFVRTGKIQYLSDCKHELAGKTVDMVDIEN